MEAGSGSPAITVGIIDGPADLTHHAFSEYVDYQCQNESAGRVPDCRQPRMHSRHGSDWDSRRTVVTRRPCNLSVVPVCPLPNICRTPQSGSWVASPTPAELARAIVETVDAGANVINLSLGIISADTASFRELDEACDYAARRGVILVAASGNQNRIGFLPHLSHPWAYTGGIVRCQRENHSESQTSAHP